MRVTDGLMVTHWANLDIIAWRVAICAAMKEHEAAVRADQRVKAWNEAIEAAKQEALKWSDAYPLSMWPEPPANITKRHECISASMGRHISKITVENLEGLKLPEAQPVEPEDEGEGKGLQ